MLKLRSRGVLILSLLFGACAPDSNREQVATTPDPDHHLIMFVGYGLSAANEGLMVLEAEADEVVADSDTMVTNTVARLRAEYQDLSDKADSLLTSTDLELNQERLGLREELVQLTRSVEETRFELIEESQQYRETAMRRLTELDQRMYELTSDIDEAGFSDHFDEMVARLYRLRDEAAVEVAKLENATTEQFGDARDDVTDALANFSARLIEAETEYDTAAAEGKDSMMSEGMSESEPDEQAAVDQ